MFVSQMSVEKLSAGKLHLAFVALVKLDRLVRQNVVSVVAPLSNPQLTEVTGVVWPCRVRLLVFLQV